MAEPYPRVDIDQVEADFVPAFPAIETNTDDRRRISLARLQGPQFNRYRLFEKEGGKMILVPLVDIPLDQCPVELLPSDNQ